MTKQGPLFPKKHNKSGNKLLRRIKRLQARRERSSIDAKIFVK